MDSEEDDHFKGETFGFQYIEEESQFMEKRQLPIQKKQLQY